MGKELYFYYCNYIGSSLYCNYCLKIYVTHLSVETVEIIKTLLISIFLLIVIAMIVYLVMAGIFIMKRGIHNIKKCDDELFRKIDQYKKCWGEDKHYYIKQIQIINLYYKEDGKVDELVKNKEIEKLYARADFSFDSKVFV